MKRINEEGKKSPTRKENKKVLYYVGCKCLLNYFDLNTS